MAQDDIFEVGFVADVAGESAACICHAQQTSSNPTEKEEKDLYDAIDAAGIFTQWAARSSDEATLTCVKVNKIHPTSAPPSYFNVGQAGTIGLAILPAQSSALHYWACPPFERRNIGRKHWAGLSISLTERGRLLDQQMVEERAFADLFENPVTFAGTYEFGVWSEKFESFSTLGVVRPRIVVHNIRTRRSRPCI